VEVSSSKIAGKFEDRGVAEGGSTLAKMLKYFKVNLALRVQLNRGRRQFNISKDVATYSSECLTIIYHSNLIYKLFFWVYPWINVSSNLYLISVLA